ncbi:choice-of-anchor M domain-containing protein [Gardnerella sp. 2492-Sm]|uniref:choice-of-anchor M domain-containing protein n=1 Tax=unclassified Gardnerella TaxID=2628112 RepID=UPI003D042DA3
MQAILKNITRTSRVIMACVCLCALVIGTPSSFAAGNGSDATVVSRKKSSKDFDAIKKANFEACAAAKLDKTASQPAADSKAAMCHAYKGHADVFATFFDVTSKRMVLGTLGDAFEEDDNNGVRYDTNRLIFEVGSKNIMQLSKDENNSVIKEIYATTREGVVWFFDQSGAGNTGALWPGLDTRPLYEGAGSTEVNPTVKLSLTGIEAPHNGEVFMYTRSGDGYEKMLGSADGWPKDVDITDTKGKHEHMYWSFNRPGVYKLKMKATATVGVEEQSSEQIYTFHVTNHDVTAGDFADYDGPSFDGGDGDEDSEDEEDSEDSDADSNYGGGINLQQSNGAFFINGNNNTVYVTPSDAIKHGRGLVSVRGLKTNAKNTNNGSLSLVERIDKEQSEKKAKKCSKFKDIKGEKLVIDHGHVDVAVYTDESNKVNLAIQEDVTGSHVLRDADSVVFAVDDAGKTNGLYRIPQTQIDGVPWMGWNNQSMNPHKPTQLSLTGVDGPGDVRVWMFGGLGGGDQEIFSTQGETDYTIPSNTHAHANWDFSEPGYYTLQFQASDGNSTITRNIHVAVGVDPQETPMSCSVNNNSDETSKTDVVKNPFKPLSSQKKDDGKENNISQPINPITNLATSGGNSGANKSFTRAVSGFAGKVVSGKSLPKSEKKNSDDKKPKGLVSKINKNKLSPASYRKKLAEKVDSVEDEPKGISGLFKRNPTAAYTLLGVGTSLVLSVLGTGFWILYKRGLINLSWLLRY